MEASVIRDFQAPALRSYDSTSSQFWFIRSEVADSQYLQVYLKLTEFQGC